jgi:uncharacterized protein (TIGR02646 family)
MLRIVKAGAPDCVRALRETPGADWGTVTGAQKAEMRAALLAEQGHLCAYCMGRIEADACTVEHWRPRSAPDTDPFAWADLLAVCDGGGAGRDRRQTHCDRHRGDAPLQDHPAHPIRDVEKSVGYDPDGTIRAADAGALNLNHATLVRNRAQVVSAMLASLDRADATRLRQMLDRWGGAVDTRRMPYAGIVVYFLSRKLERANRRGRRLRKAPR